MAIFHLSASIISRKAGRSSTAAAAYRSAEKIVDERTGEIHDYERKRGLEHKEIIVPVGMDTPERKDLWNAVEQKNKRADAQVAREITLALPCELTPEQRTELAQEFAHSLANKYSLAVDLAIHGPGREGDTRNHHAHILMTTNRFEGVQNGEIVLGNKARELDMIASAKSEYGKTNAIENIREEWAHLCNMALEKSGELTRVDHRSLSAQGVERAPTIHQGPAATSIERRGEESRLAEINDDIAEYNRQIETIAAAQKEIAEINRLLSEMQIDTPEEKAIEPPAEIVQKLPEVDKEKQQKKEQEDALLKEAGLYGKTAREASSRLYQAQEQLHSADVSLFHAKQEQQKHNHEVDNMGFLKRNLNANFLNQRAQDIDKKIELCTADYVRKQEAIARLEKAHSILENREREAREQHAQTPQGKSEEIARERRRAELLKEMEQKRERERERGRGR